jgi:hypothetical protein
LGVIMLVLIGGMIRIDACILQVALAVPVALWLAFGVRHATPFTLPSPPEAGGEGSCMRAALEALSTGRGSFRFSVFSSQWGRVVMVPLVIAVGIICLLRFSQSYLYATRPGWEHFEEFNSLRAQFTDFQASPFDDDTRAIYERAGWSKNDYQMLMSWFFANPDLYSIEKFKAILSVLPYRPESFKHQLYALGQRALGGQSLQLMLVGALAAVFFVGSRGGLAGIAIVFITAGGAIVLVLLILRRMPPQVYGPIMAFVPAIAMILPGPRRLRRPWRGLRLTVQALFLALAACLLVDTLDEWSRTSAMVAAARRNFFNAFYELRPGSDRIYVSWGAAFPYELVLDDEDFATLGKLNLVAAGCLMQTPAQIQRLRDLGIANLYRSVFEDPRVFVICDVPLASQFELYVKEHYSKTVKSRLLVEKPLGEYRAFNITEARYEPLPRVLWVRQFEER